MRMEVHLDTQGLWEVVVGMETYQQKDILALSTMLAIISETFAVLFDIKKSAKVKWEIIRSFHVGIDCFVQSRVQGLRREFKNLVMKKYEKVSDIT